MIDPATPAKPDWTRRCKATDLDDIPPGAPYMLRTSDDDTSPWRSVKDRHQGFWTDDDTGARVYYMTVEFHGDESQRILNYTDEIELGLIRPPWWTDDMGSHLTGRALVLMTDWGAVSSWVAAGISVTAFGAGTVRAWWNRPQVDWALWGELKMPNYSDPASTWLYGPLKMSNFGDGPAHRVSIHIQRGAKYRSEGQVVGTASLMKPGDSVEFETGVSIEDFENAEIWATWTPPPIRRRRERTSSKQRIAEHLTLSQVANERFESFKSKRATAD